MFPQTVIVTGNLFTELLVLNSWAMGTHGGNPKGGQGYGICSDQTHEALGFCLQNGGTCSRDAVEGCNLMLSQNPIPPPSKGLV